MWLDSGITPCVKTLEAIVGAQQKNRSHSLDESFMRGRPSLCTNLVPERPIEWFSHSQDPERNSDHANKCVSKVLQLAPEASYHPDLWGQMTVVTRRQYKKPNYIIEQITTELEGTECRVVLT